MAMIELDVLHEVGLHARPASKFVQAAAAYPCEITIKNLSSQSNAVNAKSILSVLTLGVNQGHRIQIEANGERSEEAVQSLKKLIEENFGE